MNITEESDTLSATLKTRLNFAVAHMRSAVMAAHAAHKVEQANLGEPHGAWFEIMRMHVPVAVVMSAAALEANLHETIQDILDNPAIVSPTDSQLLLLKQLLGDQSGNPLRRYRDAALVLGKVPNNGAQSWHRAKMLVVFRNHFMHYRPAWTDAEVHGGKLAKQLKAEGLPLYEPYASPLLFPYAFMTYGCAKWSVDTALAFSEAFSNLVGVRDRFKRYDFW